MGTARFTLRQARRFRDKTIEDVASAVGISRWTYMNYEKHPEKMSFEMAGKICNYLGFKAESISFLPSKLQNVEK